MAPELTPANALRRAGAFARGARVVRLLHAAPTKTSWLVERRGERCVLRVDQPLAARLGLDRGTELAALRAAARAGLAPEPLWLDRAAPAVLVLRYAPGRAWRADDLRDPRRLERLAAVLRGVHALAPPLPRLDLAAALGRYAALAARADRGGGGHLARARGAIRLARDLERDAGPPRLCHHDPVAANVVGHRRTVLIDWEYAALGDPLFDLAVVTRHHRLPERAVARFVAAYFGGSAGVPRERLAACRALYDGVRALWQAAVAAGGAGDPRPGQGAALHRSARGPAPPRGRKP